MSEPNRLQAVLPREKDAIGIAGGFPVRLQQTVTNVQGLTRGPRVPIPHVNQIVEGMGSVRIVGGAPGRNGMVALLDPVTLLTSDMEVVGTECLTGFAELSDIQVAVNAKGLLFNRWRGGTWTEQPAHQGACTGILKVNDRTFVVTTVSTDRSVRVWDPVRQRQRMFFKGFENALVAVHSVREVTVVIDAAGQVFTIGETGKPVKAGGQSGYPCCSWIARSGEASVFIAQRGGMIHRIPISV
jgi:hypothetical protein